MSYLVLDRLDKRFGDLRVLDAVSLEVREGEVLALLGPSGSGKTTLLRLLAGFEVPDAGRILLGGDDVAPLPPERRRFGMVFQHYALFPHLTVGENVAFGLEARGRPDPEEVRRRVAEALAQVDLAGFEERRPGQISGGQQQRVALARALATRPRVLLLDEPLSNLDPALRERTRRELAAAVGRVGITTVLVTHEQEEAFDLGDRVAVLHDGRLDQVGTPEALYETPATRFVATFVGRASVLPARLAGDGRAEVAGTGVPWPAAPPPTPTSPGKPSPAPTSASPGKPAPAPTPTSPEEPGSPGVSKGGGRPPEPGSSTEPASEPAATLPPGSPVDLVVRPEALDFVAATDPGALPGTVRGRRYTGLVTLYRVALEAGPEVEVAVQERQLAAGSQPLARLGQRVHLAPRPEGPAPRAFPADAGGETR